VTGPANQQKAGYYEDSRPNDDRTLA
jgi:hypothetical protein